MCSRAHTLGSSRWWKPTMISTQASFHLRKFVKIHSKSHSRNVRGNATEKLSEAESVWEGCLKGWRNGSTVKSADYSFRGPRSQHPRGSSQTATSSSRGLSSGLHMYRMSMVHIHYTCRQNAPTHKISKRNCFKSVFTLDPGSSICPEGQTLGHHYTQTHEGKDGILIQTHSLSRSRVPPAESKAEL